MRLLESLGLLLVCYSLVLTSDFEDGGNTSTQLKSVTCQNILLPIATAMTNLKHLLANLR
jgi:hypothetical protein